MMLMDGQLSHIGFEVRCRSLSALLAVDDEAGDEDMDKKESTCNKTRRGEWDVGRDGDVESGVSE